MAAQFVSWRSILNSWRALRSTPRTLLYPVLGVFLAVTTSTALLAALGLPDADEGKTRFLVAAYSVVLLYALLGYLLGG